MAEIIGVLTSVEDDSYDNKDFKKVTLDTGQVLKVKQGREGALKAKWDLLQMNKIIKFTMKDFTTSDGVKIPFVNDIEIVETPPPQTPELIPIDQEKIDRARDEVKQEAPPPAPQAVGMMTKEIGDMIRAKYLVSIYGQEASNELIKWYRGQTLGITRIPFDSSKLPKFE